MSALHSSLPISSTEGSNASSVPLTMAKPPAQTQQMAFDQPMSFDHGVTENPYERRFSPYGELMVVEGVRVSKEGYCIRCVS